MVDIVNYTGLGRLIYSKFPVFHSIEEQVSSAFRAHIQIRYGIDLAVAV